LPRDDYDDGDGDAANVDDDDDDDNDEYLHYTMESRYNLEMNGNRGRHLVRAETDWKSGTQSEPSNRRS